MRKSYVCIVLLVATALAWAQEDSRDRNQGHEGRGLGVIRIADTDQNQTVSSEEWEQFIGTLNLTESGQIDLVAFHELMQQNRPQRPEHGQRHHRGPRGGEGVPQAGKLPPHFPFDSNQNGIFEVADLDQIFNSLDQDGDGNLSQDELPQRRGHRRGERRAPGR